MPTTFPCPVCSATMAPFDTATVLGRFAAEYHRCPECGVVATRETPWLAEAYTARSTPPTSGCSAAPAG